MSKRSLLVELAVANAFVSQLFDQSLGEAGVRPTQLGVLLLIREAEPVTPTELERTSGLASATLRDRISLLQREGLVERRPSPTDRRSYQLRTTPAGRSTLQQARPVIRRVERLLETRLEASLEDYRTLITALGSAAQHSVAGRPAAGAGSRTAGPW